jgi:hypothetical protein
VYALDVYVSGAYAYVEGRGLGVVDVSNPAAPVEVGYLPMRGAPTWRPTKGVHVSGPFVYVAAGRDGLLIARMLAD